MFCQEKRVCFFPKPNRFFSHSFSIMIHVEGLRGWKAFLMREEILEQLHYTRIADFIVLIMKMEVSIDFDIEQTIP